MISDTNNQDELRQFLRDKLEQRGWELKTLAARANVNPASLSNFLTGNRRMGARMLRRIAQVFPEDQHRLLELGGLIDTPSLSEEDKLWEALRNAFGQLDSNADRLTAIKLIWALAGRGADTSSPRDHVRGGSPRGPTARGKRTGSA